jgi:ATP-dependent Clp protease protease subunit
MIKFVAKGSEAEIYIYEPIGEPGYFEDGITAKAFGQDLAALGKVNKITCRINSPGGSVFDGLAIYNLLASHPAKVTMCIDGLAASIASVIAMAGDTIEIADNATMMIHDAWGMVMGNAAEMRKQADVLQAQSENIAALYVKRSSTDFATIRDLMEKETWLLSEDCVKYGLADKVTDNMKPMACVFNNKKFKYRNVPKAIVEVVALDVERDKRLRDRVEAAKADLTKINLAAQRATKSPVAQ